MICFIYVFLPTWWLINCTENMGYPFTLFFSKLGPEVQATLSTSIRSYFTSPLRNPGFNRIGPTCQSICFVKDFDSWCIGYDPCLRLGLQPKESPKVVSLNPLHGRGTPVSRNNQNMQKKERCSLVGAWADTLSPLYTLCVLHISKSFSHDRMERQINRN